MQLMPMLFYILFGVALFGGGGTLLHMMPPPTSEAPPSGERVASAEPKAKQPETSPGQREPQSAPSIEQSEPAPQAGTEGQPAPAAPSFDVVRIERGGDGVVAGRAEPGWTVIVEANEREVARATADEFGEWTVVLAEPLPPGDYSIGLRALAKGGTRGLSSEEHVSVSIASGADAEKTVVALSKPGEPTRVLTPSEPAAPQAAPETTQPAGTKAAEEAVRTEAPEAASAPKPPAQAPAAPTDQQVKQPSAETATLAQPEAKPQQEATPQQEVEPAPATPEVAVSFSAVDYEAAAGSGGRLFLSGQATAGARVNLYLDNRRIGEAIAGPDGAWTFESRSKLSANTQHKMRADAVQADGQVASRAEVEFTPPVVAEPETQVAARTEPPAATAATPPARPEAPAAATAARQPPAASATPPEVRPQERKAAADVEKQDGQEPPAVDKRPQQREAGAGKQDGQEPEAVAEKPQESAGPDVAAAAREPAGEPDAGEKAVLSQKRSIVVRRGDTLWHIAERRYGSGIRYTAIYRDNRDQIRDPHWIYPGQEFSLPPN